MWAPRNAGVFLQEIQMPQYKEITIKLIRENTENNTTPFSDNVYNNITTMSLNFNYEGTDEHKLDFDPWSDMNINGDNSIDEKDVGAITKLALAYHNQTVIDLDSGVFISLAPPDLVDIFDPEQPVPPLPPAKISVSIEVVDMEDRDQPELDFHLIATSLDDGATFRTRRLYPHSRPMTITGLDELVKTFIKFKL
ncbi:hypothetical protein [Pseudomonas sp. GV085]|jgi:hypothetical protein|uniref:hypothetical protein n=1 Tax=Pseudomonas sp. GV085 TaxID=2135756 RepID=UPI000D4AAB5B|nr:hypothetical protein [Pseudomonas sp. GV085]PTR21685.1 hypothetical protein C8K63_11262 [Pseudomonas sp. GV085]